MLTIRRRWTVLAERLREKLKAVARRFVKNSGMKSGLQQEEPCYELSEVLRRELEALKPGCFADASWDADEQRKRRTAYQIAHEQNLAALALSGGGIRSACVALGVIQSLAEARLLDQFHYLSTVSGGGYIGSWLSAWLYWNKSEGKKATEVLTELISRRGNPDEEPRPIRHLRAYSSYLTPKLGLTSADTWTAVTLVVRNLVLNWLILVPAFCLLVLSVKIAAGLLHTSVIVSSPIATVAVVLVLLTGAGWSLGYKLLRLYPTRAPDPHPSAKREQGRFLWLSVLPAIAAGFCFAWLADKRLAAVGTLPHAAALIALAIVVLLVVVAVLGAARYIRPTAWDIFGWVFGAASAGAAMWLGLYLCRYFYPPRPLCVAATGAELVLVVFGMPWFMLSMLVGQLGYVLARSYSPKGDFEREWLGRAGGWFIIAALAWIVLSGLVLLGSELATGLEEVAGRAQQWLAALGGVGALSGLATAFLGKSSSTPARGQATSLGGTIANYGLAIAGPLFAAILVILLSAWLDAWVLGAPLSTAAILAFPSTDGDYWSEWRSIGVAVLVLGVIVLTADFLVNVNRFSLHAIYRNRLIRAFLGGPDPQRRADGFTGFDPGDNLRMHQMWDEHVLDERDWRPFHVINMTLNLAATTRLAWQQRKAESFTVTPQFCGCSNLGYRRTREYGNPGDAGISLGTAMAISGAAVSPNMGYHSSPSIAFLLTLLNVRLGWWLGNPGPGGDQDGWFSRGVKTAFSRSGQALAPYRQDAPWLSLRPLLVELFGLTDDNSPYVYLSDGGHFEDLGIYEMVRRRCRWIVVSDADADPDRGFEDLGNAVRKIWIDLGARITFENSDLLRATEDTKPIDIPYCALGTIEYLNDGDGSATGKILYIKPAVRGDEPVADIIAYLRAHEDFPQQSTAEQWFDEPQLESYRVLGYWMTKRIVDAAKGGARSIATLEQFFAALEKLDLAAMIKKQPATRDRRTSIPSL